MYQKWFLEPLACGKFPIVSVLKAKFSHRCHDNTSFLDKILFLEFLVYLALITLSKLIPGLHF